MSWRWRRRVSRSDLPVIIGGFYRSGTTLLRRLLDAHPALHCPAELKFFRSLLGEYADDPYSHLRFFNTCRTLPLNDAERLEALGHGYVRLRERAAAALNKPRWADKDPENGRYLPLWQQLLGDGFLYVHLLREPLDVFTSLREAGFDKSVPSTLSGQLAQYRANVEPVLAFAREAPERIRVLHYESLTTQPEATLEALLAWLALAPNPGLIDQLTDPARGRGLEDKKIDGQPGIHTRSIGRGGRELDAASQRLISAETETLYAWLSHQAEQV